MKTLQVAGHQMLCSCEAAVSPHEKGCGSHAEPTRVSWMGVCSPDQARYHQQCSCPWRMSCFVDKLASISSHETITQTLASSLHRVNLPVNRRQALFLEEGIGLGEVLTSKEPLHSQPSHEQPTGILEYAQETIWQISLEGSFLRPPVLLG